MKGVGYHLYKCERIKLRGSPKALVTKVVRETLRPAPLMNEGKVISLEIKQTNMGNRGSKSDTSSVSVKEQRVDGSSVFYLNSMRCTLVAGKPVLVEN